MVTPAAVDFSALIERLDALDALAESAMATSGDPNEKWAANHRYVEFLRTRGHELVAVVRASAALCTQHGGRPKTRLVAALACVDRVLADVLEN